MPVTQKDLGNPFFNVGADIFGYNRNEASPYQFDPNAFKYKNAGLRQDQINTQMGVAQNEQAPLINPAQISTGPQEQFRKNQINLISGLQGDINAPTSRYASQIASGVLQSATDRGIKQNMALGTSQRGGVNPTMIARTILDQNAGMQQQAAQSAVTTGAQIAMQEDQARMQNKLAQQGLLSGVISGGRGQDIQTAGDQAQLTQQSNIANQNTILQQRQLRDNMVRDLMSKGLSIDQAQMQADMALQQSQAQADATASGLNMGVGAANAAALGKIGGGLIQGIGSAVAMSDIREKEDIDYKAGQLAINDFLKSLKPAKYKYKDTVNGEGEHVSVMAQQLEKTSLGKKGIREMGGKKFVDYIALLPAMLSAEATLHKRLRKLEKVK